MRLRRNSRPQQLLKGLAIGAGILILSTVSPHAGAELVRGFIKGYFRKKKLQKGLFLRDLRSLQQRKLIGYRELDDGQVEIRLTKLGKEVVLRHNLEKIKLKKLKNWDRKWRLILFDIPHHIKRARDAFRRKLLDLECYPLQKSVFITPWPCVDEIDFIASIFDVRNHVLILYVSHFEGEEKLRHYFGI